MTIVETTQVDRPAVHCDHATLPSRSHKMRPSDSNWNSNMAFSDNWAS